MTFKVTLSPSGHSFEVDQETSILTAGLAAGYYIPYSCRQGHCGNCKGEMIQGSVDHGASSQTYLPETERKVGKVLLCQATARSDVIVQIEEIQGLEGLKPRMVPCRSVSVNLVSPDVAILRVRLPMNEHMLFAAGQYVEFVLPDGSRRCYSIANPPSAEGADELEFHLRYHKNGRFTNHVFNKMKPRELLKFEGPLGTLFLRDSNKPIIFCVTGTGFAPIKSMLLNAFATGQHRRREMRLYWGGRVPDDLYMREIVQQWAEEYSGFSFHAVLSRGGDGHEGFRRGYVQHALLEDLNDLSDHEVYASGSPAMVEALRSTLCVDRGLPAEAFYADAFLPASTKTSNILTFS